MPDTNEIPRYRVVAWNGSDHSFMAPHNVDAGSEVEWDGPPGPHLEPLNSAATARLEAWYDEPFPAKNEKGKVIPNEFEYPHAKYRVGPYVPGDQHSVRVLALPPKSTPGVNPVSLAEIQLRTPTDQRPGPDPQARRALAAEDGAKITPAPKASTLQVK